MHRVRIVSERNKFYAKFTQKEILKQLSWRRSSIRNLLLTLLVIDCFLLAERFDRCRRHRQRSSPSSSFRLLRFCSLNTVRTSTEEKTDLIRGRRMNEFAGDAIDVRTATNSDAHQREREHRNNRKQHLQAIFFLDFVTFFPVSQNSSNFNTLTYTSTLQLFAMQVFAKFKIDFAPNAIAILFSSLCVVRGYGNALRTTLQNNSIHLRGKYFQPNEIWM